MRAIELLSSGVYRNRIKCFLTWMWLCIVGTCATTQAQSHPAYLSRGWCDNVIVPQSYRNAVHAGRGAAYASKTKLQLQQIAAHVEIRDQVAQTNLLVSIHNPSTVQQTAEILLPIPRGAVVRSFTFNGAAKEPATELLESDKAKYTFESIVAKLKDPALLEFAGYNMIRSSVFSGTRVGRSKGATSH